MPRFKKTFALEYLFKKRWDPATGELSNPTVTLNQVAEAIKASNAADPNLKLNAGNTANFFKDIVRKAESANNNWPQLIRDAGYTAEQVTGGGNCFRFIKMAEGQTTPFIGIYPTEDTPEHRVQSISLPIAMRRLGRADEPWLTQVLVHLKILESHFSLFSQRDILQLDHLQSHVELGDTEIDALFVAWEAGDPLREIVVTCEAKGLQDDILLTQIATQVKAAFEIPTFDHSVVIPVAAKAIERSKIFVVEYEAISRTDSESLDANALRQVKDVVYRIQPSVPGIGERS